MPTVNISETVTINAPKSTVWAILADFHNIADWTSAVKVSTGTSEATGGVGATRRCELAPMGTVHEEITVWEPEDKLVILIGSVSKLPIKRSETTFTLKSINDGTTEVTMSPKAEPKGGFMAGFVAKRLAKGLPKATKTLLGDLRTAAEARATASA